jgi:hypothetical protein
MGELSKRSTVYFEPEVHKALRMKAAISDASISELVNAAVRLLLLEDKEDLDAFAERAHEETLTYEALLQEIG